MGRLYVPARRGQVPSVGYPEAKWRRDSYPWGGWRAPTQRRAPTTRSDGKEARAGGEECARWLRRVARSARIGYGRRVVVVVVVVAVVAAVGLRPVAVVVVTYVAGEALSAAIDERDDSGEVRLAHALVVGLVRHERARHRVEPAARL